MTVFPCCHTGVHMCWLQNLDDGGSPVAAAAALRSSASINSDIDGEQQPLHNPFAAAAAGGRQHQQRQRYPSMPAGAAAPKQQHAGAKGASAGAPGSSTKRRSLLRRLLRGLMLTGASAGLMALGACGGFVARSSDQQQTQGAYAALAAQRRAPGANLASCGRGKGAWL